MTDGNLSERELAHMSEGALVKATQSAENARRSAVFAMRMFGNDAESLERWGPVGELSEAIGALDQVLLGLEHEWNHRRSSNDSREEQ